MTVPGDLPDVTVERASLESRAVPRSEDQQELTPTTVRLRVETSRLKSCMTVDRAPADSGAS